MTATSFIPAGCAARAASLKAFKWGAPSIIATNDGGGSWATEPFPGTVTNFAGISCPDALYRTADDLPLDQHWIDHHAAIMGDGVILDPHAAKFDIDLHHRGMRGV